MNSSRTENSNIHLFGAWTRYSSWTARIVLVLEYFQIPYSAEFHDIYDKEGNIVRPPTPSGLVPMLAVSDLDVTIHDSLAILEFLVEEYPEKALYPTDKKLRALARSISNEMHSGFRAVTGNYPVNYLVRYGPGVPLASGAQKALDRLCEIWEGARTVTEKELGQEDGGFLFGGFTIPDAMYWPILWRIRTYNLPINPGPKTKKWLTKMWSDPVFKLMEEDINRQGEDPKTFVPIYENIYGKEIESGRFEKGWLPEY